MSQSVDRADIKSVTEEPRKFVEVRRRVLLPLMLTFLSVIIMMYPVIVTQLTNLEQMRVSQEYSNQIIDTPDSELINELDRAKEYNRSRAVGPILDPWLARIADDNETYNEYLTQLSSFGVMGRVVIPTINVDLPIYHGTSEKSLQRGVGHLFGTHLPVGGSGTHAVLTAHSGLRNATLFDNLPEIAEGDSIYLLVSGQKIKYQVHSIDVVLPSETETLVPQNDKDLLTLITCTPYGINSHRLLVHAHAVPLEDDELTIFSGEAELNWQWWMFALMAATLALILGMALWVRNVVKNIYLDVSDNLNINDKAKQ